MRHPTRNAFASLVAAAGLALPLLTPTPASAATTTSRFANYRYGACLRETSGTGLKGDVYPQPCNGGSYQKWRTVQPAARSAVMLRSVGTGRCPYQQDNGYYPTAACDRNAQNQRFTIG